MKNRSVPEPEFEVGEVVFVADTRHTSKEMDCPDCGGTGTWTAKTPAGETFEVPCQRCSDYNSELPGLTATVWEPKVRKLTVGSIQIDTAPHRSEPIQYMMEETGVGTGRLYDGSRVYATREGAMTHAEAMAAKRQENADEKPHHQEKRELSTLTISKALRARGYVKVFWAWSSYRRLRDDIDRALEEAGTLKDLREQTRHALDWDARRETRSRGDLTEKLLAAAADAAEQIEDEELAERLEDAVDELLTEAGRDLLREELS